MHKHLTNDSKSGCAAFSTGELCFTNLYAEQVKPLLPTQAVLLEIPFYLFFITLPLCVSRSLKTWASRLKTRKCPSSPPKKWCRVSCRFTVFESASPKLEDNPLFFNDHGSRRPPTLENEAAGLEFRPSFTLSSQQRKVLFFHSHLHFFFHGDELISWQKTVSPRTLNIFLPPQNRCTFKEEKTFKTKTFLSHTLLKPGKKIFLMYFTENQNVLAANIAEVSQERFQCTEALFPMVWGGSGPLLCSTSASRGRLYPRGESAGTR